MFGNADRIAASLGRSTPFIGAVARGGVRVPRRPVQHRRRGPAARRRHRRGLGRHALVAGRRARSDRASRSSSLPAPSAARSTGGIPGVLKAKTGAHEVIVTIMLNNIAILYRALARQLPGPARSSGTRRASVPRTRAAARLPPGSPRSSPPTPPVHLGFFLARRPVRAWSGSSSAARPSASRCAPSGPTRTRPSTPAWGWGARSSSSCARRVPSPAWPVPARSPGPRGS